MVHRGHDLYESQRTARLLRVQVGRDPPRRINPVASSGSVQGLSALLLLDVTCSWPCLRSKHDILHVGRAHLAGDAGGSLFEQQLCLCLAPKSLMFVGT